MIKNKTHAEKRLAIIDLYLAFKGKVQRSDLIRHFEISTATASRTMKEYRELCPHNITYSISDRTYVAPDTFEAMYSHNLESALRLLAYGEEVSSIGGKCYGINFAKCD